MNFSFIEYVACFTGNICKHFLLWNIYSFLFIWILLTWELSLQRGNWHWCGEYVIVDGD